MCDLLKILTDFEVKFCKNYAGIIELLADDYKNWEYFKQIIIKIAEKLSKYDNPRLLSECLYILMNHEFKPRFWDAGSFVLILNYAEKELTKIFFYIIHGIISHPNFGPYCERIKQNCDIQLGYSPIHTRDWSCKLVYNGFEFYDELVEINGYFMGYIPVHRPMPFFQSRLPLCDFDVSQSRKSSLAQRQQMLVISSLSRLLICKLFCFNLHSQTKTILLQNF
jgi:hypothetical protein